MKNMTIFVCSLVFLFSTPSLAKKNKQDVLNGSGAKAARVKNGESDAWVGTYVAAKTDAVTITKIIIVKVDQGGLLIKASLNGLPGENSMIEAPAKIWRPLAAGSSKKQQPSLIARFTYRKSKTTLILSGKSIGSQGNSIKQLNFTYFVYDIDTSKMVIKGSLRRT